MSSRLLAALGCAVVALSLVGCPGTRDEASTESVRQPPRIDLLSHEPEVRIRLSAVERRRSMRVRIEGDWTLLDLDGRELATGRRLDQALPVDLDAPWVQGTRTPSAGFVLRPHRDEDLQVDDRRHPGTLRVARSVDGRLRAYVVTHLERYLLGVVGGEIPATFPRESQRVQAILARTYALSTAPGGGEPITLSDTGREDQEYHGLSGVAEHRRIAEDAVRSTTGQVVVHDGRPLRCWYHSTCGGHTVPSHTVFPVAPSEPLAGVHVDRCQESKYYRWTGRLPVADVLSLAGLKGPLRSFGPGETLDHGRSESFRVVAADGEVELSAPEARLRLGPSVLRSTWVTSASVVGAEVHVEGRGWGHGVGMCQMGAKALAEDGLLADAILGRYYPGSTVERVW